MKEWRRPSLRRVIVLILIERNGEGGIHSYLGTFLFERRLRQILRTLEEQHEVTQKGWGLTKRHPDETPSHDHPQKIFCIIDVEVRMEHLYCKPFRSYERCPLLYRMAQVSESIKAASSR